MCTTPGRIGVLTLIFARVAFYRYDSADANRILFWIGGALVVLGVVGLILPLSPEPSPLRFPPSAAGTVNG